MEIMDMKEKMNEWQCQNEILQCAYKDYLLASQQKDKDIALMRIQSTLEQNPFMSFCVEHNADVFGIIRYGLDYQSEQCIDLIDKIAKGEMNYDF